MSDGHKGSDLFIVDNSISGWTGSRYLRDWVDFADRFDIATGWFDIGSLLELDGAWQRLRKIRILMGSDTGASTKALIARAVRDRAELELDSSLETEKSKNPFLDGTDAIVEALKSGQIECRVYLRDKFHAKTYITHARSAVIGPRALVGSSNFTRPGLTENVELNIQVQSAQEVAELQKWYEHHWDQAEDVTPEVLSVLDRHTRHFTPFDVYARALHEFFRGHELTAGEWDQTQSQMFPKLDRYQREAYWSLMKIADEHGGAFLCDGVGLGKTFVGLMLIERLILHEGKRVVLFAPKAAREAVWEPHIRQLLGHIGSGNDFSNLAIFNHTDLGRKGEFPERFERIAKLADAVIIDEAHHFRNPGWAGVTGRTESRYRKLFRLLDGESRPKSVFLLTATPINNQIADLRHMIELFSRGDDSYFAQTIGISNLRAHFLELERQLRRGFGDSAVSEGAAALEAQKVVATSPTFEHLVVQRSRAYAKASQIRETGAAAAFPERKAPKVAEYSIRKTYGTLLDDVEKAFSSARPLFTLAIYYPLAYYMGPDESIDPTENNRQYQVVGLIRTNFLKRFESSVRAFERSCERLLKKLLAWVEVHSVTESDKKRFERWLAQNSDLLGYVKQLTFDDVDAEDDEEEDLVPQELIDAVEELDPDLYKVGEILDETYLDLDQILRFLSETRRFEPKHDDKLQKLIRLLKSKELQGRKVLIFSEFADTARYLAKHLDEAGFEGIEELDSTSKKHRPDVITRFSPYYNGSSSGALARDGKDEIRVLIATDVLSEGLNLQDATLLINYDIHWNPVRLMQRIGRVDRRMNPEVEERLKADHPELASDRGSVRFWNFLPPDELNALLSLYTKVTQKTLLISKTQGIEGRQLLTPDDEYEALREFNANYEGTTSGIEAMRLEYQALLDAVPGLRERLDGFPGAIFSGRERAPDGLVGAFFCYGLPALDRDLGCFTLEVGSTRWYFYDQSTELVLDDPSQIVDSIRSAAETARHVATERRHLIDMRRAVEKHIKNGYLKQVNAPIGVAARLLCWMEVNVG